MGVQVKINRRGHSATRGGGYYLMELRQHVAEASTRRSKLFVNEWSAPRISFVPILQRPPRIGPEE